MKNIHHYRFAEGNYAFDFAHAGKNRIFFNRIIEAADPSLYAWIDYVEVPAGADIGLHRHGDDEEIYIVISGQAEMLEQGQAIVVGPGDVIRNPPFGEHSLRNRFDDPLRMVVVAVGK